MAVTNCRYFNGYKPCGKSDECTESCSHKSIALQRILIVHLGALGAVLRSTSLLAAIRRKYTGAHITWITQKPAQHLLAHNPYVDRVLTADASDLLALSTLQFDVVFCIDKSLQAIGIAKLVKSDQIYGFTVEAHTGAIVPATESARYLWQLGLSNHEKFFVNKKTEQELVAEALDLKYTRDPYIASLSESEELESKARRNAWAPDGRILVGLNTGCSPVIPYKKLTVEMQRRLVSHLIQKGYRVVLLGGPEDTVRNQQIAYGLDVISSSTVDGLRDGLISVDACDIVCTGDSLGMHMAIARKKWTVAWFGPTCAHEIDLYDRGFKVLTDAACAPCWKRTCHKQTMCYDLVNLEGFITGVETGVQWLRSSSIQHSSGILSSPSRSCGL